MATRGTLGELKLGHCFSLELYDVASLWWRCWENCTCANTSPHGNLVSAHAQRPHLVLADAGLFANNMLQVKGTRQFLPAMPSTLFTLAERTLYRGKNMDITTIELVLTVLTSQLHIAFNFIILNNFFIINIDIYNKGRKSLPMHFRDRVSNRKKKGEHILYPLILDLFAKV